MHREILGEPLRVLCVSVVKVLLIQTETAIKSSPPLLIPFLSVPSAPRR
jgi:hypothetical protein